MGISFFFGFIFTSLSLACTTVQLSASPEKVVAKSYDWYQDSAFVMLNKKNVAKKAFLVPFLQKGPAAKWTSKHASITFNQYGAELPNSGMNDAGLVVEVMWLDDAKAPKASNTEAVNELQWIQYQLDNYATVEDVIKNQEKIRVSQLSAPVHYMACDATGTCATFEYLEGSERMTINGGGKNVFPTLTNDTYTKSVDEYEKFLKGGDSLPEKCVGSLDRFFCATEFAKKFDLKLNPINYAFETLNRVWVNSPKGEEASQTVWNIVYEPAAAVKKVHFRTRHSKKVKTVVFQENKDKTKGYNPSCKEAAQIYDMNSDVEGNVTDKFKEFTLAENKEYLKKAVAGDDKLQAFVEIASQYPTAPNIVCDEK